MRHRAIAQAIHARYLNMQYLRELERVGDQLNLMASLITVSAADSLADGERIQSYAINLLKMVQILQRPAKAMLAHYSEVPGCMAALFNDYPEQKKLWQGVVNAAQGIAEENAGFCDFARVDAALSKIGEAVGDQPYGDPKSAKDESGAAFTYRLFWTDVVEACRGALERVKAKTPVSERFETVSLG